jgi:hypothetical protein
LPISQLALEPCRSFVLALSVATFLLWSKSKKFVKIVPLLRNKTLALLDI